MGAIGAGAASVHARRETVLGRRAASPDAVHRRRMNRQERREHRRRRAEEKAAARRAEREAKEGLIVARLLRRYVPMELRGHPLFRLYAYWQARKCGWDVMKPELRYTGRRDADGARILFDPAECPTWLWWTGLHYKTRYMLAGGGRFILKEEPEPAVEITNPYFEVQAA